MGMLQIILSVVAVVVGFRVQQRTETPLLLAIEHVESGGNPNAVGDGGQAVGCLQIHPSMVDECNRIKGSKVFTLEDRKDRAKSIEMFWTYTNFWNKKTKDTSEQGMAQRWNGGPTGHKKSATLNYWKKVQAARK